MRNGILVLLLAAMPAWAAKSKPMVHQNIERVYTASSKKTSFYIKDGIFSGGDAAISDVVVLDVRRSRNKKFERLVLDLEGNKLGEPAAISRPPYYHVALLPGMRRLAVTIWGKPKLAFDPMKIIRRFRRSKMFGRNVQIFPVFKDRWRLVLPLKAQAQIEVFELSNPVRLIVDIRKDR